MHREPSDADLTAYLLDDLGGARAEYIEAHLAVCPECRERLARLQQTLGRLESMSEPDGNDLQRQSMLKARIQMEAAGMAQAAGSWMRRAQIGLVTAAMLILAITLGPSLTGAGSAAIRDLVRGDPELNAAANPPRTDPDDHSLELPEPAAALARATIDPSELPYAPLAPDTLPGSNQLTGMTAFADGAFEGLYAGPDGLELLLRQEPATTDGVRLSEDIEYEELEIDGVEAIIIYDERLNSVDQLFWVRGGMFFTLRAVRLTGDDFPLKEALQIVERLIELQDRTHVMTEPGQATTP